MPVSRADRLLVAAMLNLALAACGGGGDGPTSPPGGGPPLASAKMWSDPTAWPGGAVPVAGAAVTIPAGANIVLDTTPPPLTSLEIDGALTFANRDLALTSGWIIVKGWLTVGTAAAPYTSRAVITLTGSPDGNDIMGAGNKVLGVLAGGTLELHGAPQLSWTRLSATAAAGATSLLLEQPTNWRIGDRVVVASTDFDPMQAEEAVVASAAGTGVTLQAPLARTHFGQSQTIAGVTVDERAEVGLLSHNITIEGDSATTTGINGHIMIMQGGTAHVEGVELFRMGQKSVKARYPMHWHLAGPVPGQYFRNSSVWRSTNRCVTVHGTDDALVQNNVCYDDIGHGYFLEDGAETGNTLDHNLGLVTRQPATSGEAILASDMRPATFWLTNPDNTVRNNAAAGSRGIGFWYAFPASPTGLSAGSMLLPRTTALREFSGNVAHSNRSVGLNVDDGPKMDGSTETTFYAPRQNPAASSAAVVADFTGLLAYKNSSRAVWLRGANLRLSKAVVADNVVGATFAASETFVEDAAFIGVSANVTPLPANAVVRGYEFYDGRVGARRVTFANFSGSGGIPYSALGYNRNFGSGNGFSISTGNFGEQLSFVNATPMYLEDPHPDKDGDKAAVVLDTTGSITGTAGAFIVANAPIMVDNSCTKNPAWNAWVCTNRLIGLSLNSGVGAVEPMAPLTLIRDDAVSQALVGVPGNPQSVNMSVPTGRSYAITFAGAAPSKPRISVSRTREGEWVRIAVPFNAPASYAVVRDYDGGNPLPAVASVAAVDAGSGDGYYFDAVAKLLYVKLYTRTGRTSTIVYVP